MSCVEHSLGAFWAGKVRSVKNQLTCELTCSSPSGRPPQPWPRLGLYNSLSGSRPAEQINSDPIRIISGVIGGLGFLGAGSIIQSRGEVQGITTAATIWVVGGIGIACGLGNYVLALTSAIITFVVLFVIGKFEVSSLAPENLQNSDRKSVQLKSENESEN